VLFPRHLDAVS